MGVSGVRANVGAGAAVGSTVETFVGVAAVTVAATVARMSAVGPGSCSPSQPRIAPMDNPTVTIHTIRSRIKFRTERSM